MDNEKKIEIEITVCGGGGINPLAFVVTKGAYPAKEILKAWGYRWDPANKVWYREAFHEGHKFSARGPEGANVWDIRPSAVVYDERHALRKRGIIATFVNADLLGNGDKYDVAGSCAAVGCIRKVAKDDSVYRAIQARKDAELAKKKAIPYRPSRRVSSFEARWGISAEDIEDDLHIDTSNEDEMRAHGFVPRW